MVAELPSQRARVPARPAASSDTARRLSLMRLASPALPIGGFSYSQGLETAIDRGWVGNEAQALAWLRDGLALNVGCFEAPLLHGLCAAVMAGDWPDALRLNALHLATREGSELHAETLQMGYSLIRLIEGLHGADDPLLQRAGAASATQPGFVTTLPWAWALAAAGFDLAPDQALTAWLWSWLENQVMVTLKAVPLGQQAGQRMMSALLADMTGAIERAVDLPEEDWSNTAPGFALAGCWHETQYSRMFRS